MDGDSFYMLTAMDLTAWLSDLPKQMEMAYRVHCKNYLSITPEPSSKAMPKLVTKSQFLGTNLVLLTVFERGYLSSLNQYCPACQ